VLAILVLGLPGTSSSRPSDAASSGVLLESLATLLAIISWR
jgi:hypothetical protein